MISAIINYLIWAAIIAVAFVCIYMIYDGLAVTNSVILGEEILTYAPSDETVNIAALRDINEDIVGWIRIKDTSIDYPIMQSADNEYYLQRNCRREFATAGSIFLDYRNEWDDEFLIIYGHRMSYGGMFTDIIKFKEQSFFDEHETGELFIDNRKIIFEIVAFGLIKASDRPIYDLKEGAAGRVISRATFVRDSSATEGRYILLSTCDAQDKTMRDVLLVKISDGIIE